MKFKERIEKKKKKINSRNIVLVGNSAKEMGFEAKRKLLSVYPDAGSIRYKGLRLE